MFIEVQAPDTTFTHTPEGTQSTFELRIVPDDVEKEARKQATRKEWDKGQRTESFDVHAFLARILDYAIVDWTGIKVRDANGVSELPCTKANKLLLPEKVKSEINRLCLGKEIALDRGEEKKD